MALGGLTGILITGPLNSIDALDRLRRLLLRGADVTVIADHPEFGFSAHCDRGCSRRTLPVLVDVDVGMDRTGCLEIADVVSLAKDIAATPSLRYAGIQAYWGNLQQVMPFDERSRLVGVQTERVRAVIDALQAAKLPPGIVSGGGTGSHRIDAASGLFTEIQPGSYLFMDSCYGKVAISETGNPFMPSLFVAATVSLRK